MVAHPCCVGALVSGRIGLIGVGFGVVGLESTSGRSDRLDGTRLELHDSKPRSSLPTYRSMKKLGSLKPCFVAISESQIDL